MATSRKRIVGLLGLLSWWLATVPAQAAVGSGLGNRFTLDTRPPATEPGFAVGPVFELSTLQIAGQVRTVGGTPLQGATVTAGAIEAKSASDGSFSLVGVKPGQRYTVRAFVSGYGAQQLEDISVDIGSSVTDLAFRLAAVEEDYALVPLWTTADAASSVMQGGTAVRYFQVQTQDGQPGPPGVAVEASVDGSPFYSDPSGVVAVEVPWSQVGSGQPGARSTMRVTSVGVRTLSSPLSFAVEVIPRTYAVQWHSDGYSRVGISFVNVEKGGGTSIRLDESDGDLAQFNQIEIGREVRSGVGAEASLGAKAGVKMSQVKGARIGVGASAKAGVEGMLSSVSEDRYQFPYPERTTTQAMAQYVLIADGMVGSLSPHLVNLLAFVEGRLAGESALDNAYVYGGRGLDIMVGASAHADATAGVFGKQVRAGIGVGADVGAEGHGLLTWAEHPQEEEGSILVGVTGQGKASAQAEAGVVVKTTGSALGAAAFGGVGASGQIGGQLELFFAGTRVQRIEITTRKQGSWGYDIGAEFLRGETEGSVSGDLFGQAVEVSTTISIAGVADALQEVIAADPLGQALSARQVEGLQVGGATFERLLDAMSKAAERLQQAGRQLSVTYTKEIHQITSEGGGEIELEGQAGVSAFRVALSAGKSIDRQKVIVAERGAWIGGTLRPLETYGDDVFTPGSERTMASLVQEIHDEMGDVVKQAFSAVVQDVKEGVETVVEVGRSALKVAAGATSGAVQKVGAVVWNWWGPSPSSKPVHLPAAEYAARAKIAATAQAAAQLDYGIGGFYQLTPPGEVLSEPAELTIGYDDDEVAGLDEESLAVYSYDEESGEWLLVGGDVDAANNTVTASISVLAVYTLAPRIPSGEFELEPDMGSLPADGSSTATVLSDTVWNNDGTSVANGTLFDVWTTTGDILTEDADDGREGVQVAAAEGRLSFQFQAGEVALPAEIVVRSVAGKASGRTTLELTDAVAPSAPSGLSSVWDGEEVVLQWQANAEADLAGYRIYFSEGTSGPPYEGTASPPGQPSPVVVGTDTTARLAGLDSERTYFFTLSAYDILGNESEYASEVELEGATTSPTLAGDFDGNDAVDFDDFFLFVDRFGLQQGEAGFDAGFDLSGNGMVDFDDFFLFVDNFGKEGQGKLMALAREYLGLPVAPRLEQNFPNPFNAATAIHFVVPQPVHARLVIYDILGRPVRGLMEGEMAAGSHATHWDGKDDQGQPVASGVYVYALELEEGGKGILPEADRRFRQVKRMLLLR